MSDRSDIDRVLGHWFEDGPNVMPDRVADVVAHRISLRPQRRSRRLLGRFPMRPAITYGLAAAAVLIVAIVGYNLLPRGPSVGGPPATVTPAPTPSPVPGSIDASPFGVPLTLTLSGGWTYALVEPNNLELLHGDTDLGFHPLSKVTLPGATIADPWIPVPADFIAWVQERPEFTDFQTPRPVTVGGRPGTEIDAAFVWDAGMTKRDFLRYSSGAWLYDQGNVGHRIRFIIVPGTGGDGFIIVVNAPGADFDAATIELDTVLSTVQFIAPTGSPSS
jgi:hypothetical protein